MSRYRDTRRIEYLIIHCAATPNGKWFTAEDIDQWHAERGFGRAEKLAAESNLKHIGYQFVIYTTGAVCAGRRLDETGAHARGYNHNSIGTCLIGTDKFWPAQWEWLRKHVASIQKKYPNIKVIGHNAVDDHKTCPGFDVQAWLANDMQPLAGHVLTIEEGER